MQKEEYGASPNLLHMNTQLMNRLCGHWLVRSNAFKRTRGGQLYGRIITRLNGHPVGRSRFNRSIMSCNSYMFVA